MARDDFVGVVGGLELIWKCARVGFDVARIVFFFRSAFCLEFAFEAFRVGVVLRLAAQG